MYEKCASNKEIWLKREVRKHQIKRKSYQMLAAGDLGAVAVMAMENDVSCGVLLPIGIINNISRKKPVAKWRAGIYSIEEAGQL